jgi:hypothetical protein
VIPSGRIRQQRSTLTCSSPRAVGSGGHRSTGDSGGPVRQRRCPWRGTPSRVGARWVAAMGVAPMGAVPVPGLSHSPVDPGGVQHRAGGGFGWPVTLRSVGVRTLVRSPAAWRPLNPSWIGGETHDIRRGHQIYGIDPRYQRDTSAPTGTGDIPARAWGTGSTQTRCSCAVCHTPHGALRGRQRFEHSRQRPRGSTAWAASRAHHPEVNRGSSLRATDSSDPLSALLASSSSMSSRSHTPCRRI